jgi:hypothetical protein
LVLWHERGDIKLVATVENLVYYKRLGGFYIRTKPGKVNRTKATKKRSSEFGKANRVEKALHLLTAPVLPYPKDKPMMYRMAKALFQWLRTDPLQTNAPLDHLKGIEGLEYNPKSILPELMRKPLPVSRTVDSKLRVDIPALNPVLDIHAPPIQSR